MIVKIDGLICKTIKATAIKTAQAMVALCPSSLQTSKMVPSKRMKEVIPLIDEEEWDRYLTMPAQQPPPKIKDICMASPLSPLSPEAQYFFNRCGLGFPHHYYVGGAHGCTGIGLISKTFFFSAP